jgi:hypothetical protein
MPEILWAEGFVFPRLTGGMRESAARHGWRFVDGHVAAFEGHGYCADDNWIVRLPQSVRSQARVDPIASTFVGSVHPNEVGHRAYASAIAESLLCDLDPACRPATTTTTTSSTSTTTPTSTPTTTTIPLACRRAEDCDDGDPCTVGDACTNGVCAPGVTVDTKLVVSFLIEAGKVPPACGAGRDTRRARKVVKLMTTARRKFAKAAAAPENRRQRLLARATAKLAQAAARTEKLAGVLSPGCHAALASATTSGRSHAGCLRD